MKIRFLSRLTPVKLLCFPVVLLLSSSWSSAHFDVEVLHHIPGQKKTLRVTPFQWKGECYVIEG